MAIASREAKGARRFDEPRYRHFTGRIFSFAVKLLILRGFEDTQCGFKCFRAETAVDLFSLQRFDGWAFDVEVLYLASRRGYRIREVPISWRYQSDSRIRLVGDRCGCSPISCAFAGTVCEGFMTDPTRRRYPSLKTERRLVRNGFLRVAGLDEAGRGAWAGPLAAGAVILPLGFPRCAMNWPGCAIRN